MDSKPGEGAPDQCHGPVGLGQGRAYRGRPNIGAPSQWRSEGPWVAPWYRCHSKRTAGSMQDSPRTPTLRQWRLPKCCRFKLRARRSRGRGVAAHGQPRLICHAVGTHHVLARVTVSRMRVALKWLAGWRCGAVRLAKGHAHGMRLAVCHQLDLRPACSCKK